MEDQAESLANSLAILGPFCLFVVTAIYAYYQNKWRDQRDLDERTLRENVEKARIEEQGRTDTARETSHTAEIKSIRDGYKAALKEQTDVLEKKDVLIERMRVEQNESGKEQVQMVEGILTQVNDSSLVVGTNIAGLKTEVMELRKDLGKSKRRSSDD